ncbi:MAG: M28 family metallopeptidase [Kofleriaceae bacterium]
MKLCVGCVVGALAACGWSPDPLDGAMCAPPVLDAPWLDELVIDTVNQLSASPRATPSERDAARAALMTELSSIGLEPQLHSYATGANVVATIPATTGAAAGVIVGAHFDTVSQSPGANDNATGVAVILAVARYVRDMPCRSAPVTIVLFDEEERGLVGSRAFALTRTPQTVGAVHTIDQVGWDADGDRRFEIEQPTPALEQQYREAASALGLEISVTSVGATDHQAFRDAGFAAVGITEEFTSADTSPHRHLVSDTAPTVDVAYVALAAQLVGQVILREVTP